MITKKGILRLFLFLSTALFLYSQFGCSSFWKDPELKFSMDKVEEIDRVVQTLYENGQFSGAVLVSVNSEVVYKNAVGYADIEEGILNTCDTKFRIASFTKPFTAMLILQLVEAGKLDLDGKLIEYLPGFTVNGGEKITIHQLLTHTAGIAGEWRIPDLAGIEKKFYSREKLFECINERELVYKPGAGREYSNFGYALLGLLIEKVTGKSYDDVLTEKICEPAGMNHTLSDVTAQAIDNRAIGYDYNYFTGIERASFLDMSFVLGYGQLLSTVEDLYLFDKALYTNKLLSESSKKLFFNKYGWFPKRYPVGKGSKKIKSFVLDGSVNGFQSHTHRIEKDSVFIVSLRNIKEYKREIVIKWPTSMVPRILAILYGETYDLPKKSAAFTVFQTLIESGRNEAVQKNNEISTLQQDQYYSDKIEFVFFAEELEKKKMQKLAKEYREIFKKK
ncbi:MAG: beta-lactamase family protein [Syntrophaceae bacterium]|nr:beta-lactamase family protein [Syntrophaceae bacterium]